MNDFTILRRRCQVTRLLTTLALGAVLAAGGAAAAGTDQVLVLGNAGEPETLDPHRYNLRLEETLLTDLFLGLTTFDAEANIVPGAAASWQVSDDGLVWTFELRDGLRWSDGAPLTAHDFVYAFRRLLDPATAASLAYFMYPLANAEAVNTGRAEPAELGARAMVQKRKWWDHRRENERPATARTSFARHGNSGCCRQALESIEG